MITPELLKSVTTITFDYYRSTSDSWKEAITYAGDKVFGFSDTGWFAYDKEDRLLIYEPGANWSLAEAVDRVNRYRQENPL